MVAREGDIITKNDSIGRHPWLGTLGIQYLVNYVTERNKTIVNKPANKGHFGDIESIPY